MFTFALICRHVRQKASAWRHAGVIPKVKNFDTSLEGLETCHDCLSVILADLEELAFSGVDGWKRNSLGKRTLDVELQPQVSI
jgi:hypothetical protein